MLLLIPNLSWLYLDTLVSKLRYLRNSYCSAKFFFNDDAFLSNALTVRVVQMMIKRWWTSEWRQSELLSINWLPNRILLHEKRKKEIETCHSCLSKRMHTKYDVFLCVLLVVYEFDRTKNLTEKDSKKNIWYTSLLLCKFVKRGCFLPFSLQLLLSQLMPQLMHCFMLCVFSLLYSSHFFSFSTWNETTWKHSFRLWDSRGGYDISSEQNPNREEQFIIKGFLK